MQPRTENYSKEYLTDLHIAFNSAFSDYFTAFQPTADQFEKRIHNKLNILNELSIVALDGSYIVGFVLHTLNYYQGKLTMYNGGTGVIPSHRKQKVASLLFEESMKKALQWPDKIERVLLEVVNNNHKAISLYESVGFGFNRELQCFMLDGKVNSQNSQIIIKQSFEFKEEYRAHLIFEPSFLDSSNQVVYNLVNETILEAWWKGELTGHIIFNPNLGRISQLAVNPLYRNHGVAKRMVARAQELSINKLSLLNVPSDEIETIIALERIGFRKGLTQFELQLSL
ncbi:MAG: ribosomal protein S18 acetylase RimI-like enzyme [Marinoscillum sp.]|jgi:ribosomal protein S18 acetylase RimI-like enzyme